MIFQYANYGYSLLEALVALLGLMIIVNFAINLIYKEDIEIRKKIRLGSTLTCLIIFGIVYTLRATFETLGVFSPIFRILNNDQMFFAIMVTVFYPLHRPLIKVLGFTIVSADDDRKYSNFKKFLFMFIISTWIMAAFFLTIPILDIQMENPDVFNLGILWAFSVVVVNIFITYVINRSLPTEKRIAKPVIRKSMGVASLLAFGIWCLQLFIFELYLNRLLDIELIKQDIRVLIIVISGLYIIFFYHILKVKFLPEISEKGSKRVRELLEMELEKTRKYNEANEGELILEEVNTGIDLTMEESSILPPEGITFKIYVYFSRKFSKTPLLDEDRISESLFDKTFNIVFIALLWYAMIAIITVSIAFLIIPTISNFEIANLNIIVIKILILSCASAIFIVMADFLIIMLINRSIPIHRRIKKITFKNILFFGGILTFWICVIPFFIIYSYLFVWLNDSKIMFITNEVIYSVLMYYFGTRVLIWYAGSVKMWNKSKRKASRVALGWLIINLPLRLFLVVNILLESTTGLSAGWILMISDMIISVVNVVIGTFFAFKIYKRKFLESLRLIIGVQILLFFITIVLKHTNFLIGVRLPTGAIKVYPTGGGILRFMETLIKAYNYAILDIRIPLIVGTGIYVILFLLFSKVKFALDTSDQTMEKFRTALEATKELDMEVTMETGNNVILDVKDLTTYFYTEEGVVKAVEGVSFQIRQGEVVGLVGETGCGKSVTALSILRLVRPPGEIKSGEVIFEGENLHRKPMDEFLRYRGNKITMIFQDPLNSLNPVFKIGDQISEVYRLHMEDELLLESVRQNTSIYDIARKWSQKMLKDLNIPTPRVIFDRYPHELSGGMRQRVQIAMALACSPKLLIADEPTTALDVTIQNQILKLMKDLKKKYNTSILFITHDLGIISKMCDRVAVMYSGFIVEYGDIEKLFITPYHPYTRGLISSVPVVGKKREVLDVIPGTVPNLIYPPSGCRFHPRCKYRFEPCDSKIPRSIEMQPDYYVACHLYDPQYKDLAEISIKKVEEPITDS
ncbi:MAG: ABC transporter ATP-binding protein [Promethearchaeota archaeon]